MYDATSEAHHEHGDADKLPGGECSYLPKYRCVNVAMVVAHISCDGAVMSFARSVL